MGECDGKKIREKADRYNMHQFFVEPSQIQGNAILLQGKDVNHIKNVLRMKAGDEISVSNGTDGMEYRCVINEITAQEVLCTLCHVMEDGLELPSRIYLFQGLPKADKMELIIQKAVELGVYRVIPVACARAVVKLDAKKAAAKTARWQGIAEAAAKQSKRRMIPRIGPVMTMQEAVGLAETMDVKLIPYELAEGMEQTKQRIEEICPGQSVAVFIGPEGGFEEKEVKLAQEAGICPITLGKRILRTETAGLTVLAWIMYRLER